MFVSLLFHLPLRFILNIQVNQELARRLKEARKSTDGTTQKRLNCRNCVQLQSEIEYLSSVLQKHGGPQMEPFNPSADEKYDQRSVKVALPKNQRRNSNIIVRFRTGDIRKCDAINQQSSDTESMDLKALSAQLLEKCGNTQLVTRSTPLEEEKTASANPMHQSFQAPDIKKTSYRSLPPPPIAIPHFHSSDSENQSTFIEQAVIVATPLAAPLSVVSPTRIISPTNILSGVRNLTARTLAADISHTHSFSEESKATTGLPRSEMDSLSVTTSAELEMSAMTMSAFLDGRSNDKRKSDFRISIPSPTNGSQSASTPSGKRHWISHLIPHRFRSPTASSGSGGSFEKIPLSPSAAAREPQGPKIVSMYPSNFGRNCKDIEGLTELCFPLGDSSGSSPQAHWDFSLKNLKRLFQERLQSICQLDATFVLLLPDSVDVNRVTYAICMIIPILSDEEEREISKLTRVDATDGQKERQLSLPRQCCVCLLTKWPFFKLYFKVLYGIAAVWDTRKRQLVASLESASTNNRTQEKPWLAWSDFVDIFEQSMQRMRDMQLPRMGAWSNFDFFMGMTQVKWPSIAFHRSHTQSFAAERHESMLQYSAPTLFSTLSMDQIAFLLGCLCCELKVLLVSQHVHIVSACVLAFATLLHPLQWAGPIVTVLPPRYAEDLLDAPVPLLAGRVSVFQKSAENGQLPISPTVSTSRNTSSSPSQSNEDEQQSVPFSTLLRPMKGVIEMNLDHNTLCMHQDDLLQYHKFKLPGCDALVHDVHTATKQLFGKQRKDPVEFPNVMQSEACDRIILKIREQIEAICLLAMTVSSSSSAFVQRVCEETARREPLEDMPKHHLMHRRSSESVNEYVRRFQETQMFSTYKNSLQEEVMETG
uniref:Uncharacterized protein AlNc14C39G3380 n=1 Tax=Albugo laibachii Nc14 TaxID=890382 RepID=F0W9B3_9STRA|nr:hypothetical protein PITG_06654 [Albugo laibachii Nc14]CCA18372.1 hypothetical protein PITG_06654 [Albugo laibachii Nc14]|eukprot:CCA18372.1 hypothetical protein PITG_06654 [Albugo laibachii Nc14]